MMTAHVMDAIHEAAAQHTGLPVGEAKFSASLMRENLITVLHSLPRDLTVGDLLRELEES